MCRSVSKIRGERKQNPVVHLSGSPHWSPLSAFLWPYKNWRWSSAWTRPRHQRSCSKPWDTSKIRRQTTNNKEVELRVSPRGSQALSPHGVLTRDQAGQSARALISAFYVLKMLHLHSHVFSCCQQFFHVISLKTVQQTYCPTKQ